MLSSLICLAIVGLATAQNTQTGTSAVYAAQATATSSSPTSNVKGAAFDRFVTIWMENTDFTAAMGDPNLSALAKKGITLTNYFGVTHPSGILVQFLSSLSVVLTAFYTEPNYVASIGGGPYEIYFLLIIQC